MSIYNVSKHIAYDGAVFFFFYFSIFLGLGLGLYLISHKRNEMNECVKAAEAGIFNFYETLRVEVGPAVGITIVTPGYIESEMTKGKFMTREGRLVVDDELRDVSSQN